MKQRPTLSGRRSLIFTLLIYVCDSRSEPLRHLMNKPVCADDEYCGGHYYKSP